MEIALILIGMLAYFIFVFWYSEEFYIQIFAQYLSVLLIVLMSYFVWQYAIVQNYSFAGVFETWFILMVLTFMAFNFYLFMKFAGWVYRLVIERYIK